MTRRVRYSVAASLDGYIAGPGGEFDWIPDDPAVDFAALFGSVDAVLFGRKTYESWTALGGGGPWATGAKLYLFSRTIGAPPPGMTLITSDAGDAVARLRAEEGGDIWLFGGGELFASLLDAGQVDRVEVAVVPVLLGGGIPLLPDGAARAKLSLVATHRYPSGIVLLTYDVVASH